MSASSGNTTRPVISWRETPWWTSAAARGIFGCDIARSSLAILREKGFATVRCDAERSLPFATASFATATLVDVLEHTFYPAELLSEAARIADEVIIVVPNFNSVVARYHVLVGRVPENNTPRKQHVYWFNREALRSVIASVGLEVVEERFHTFKYRSRFLAAPFRTLGRLRPTLFSLAFAARLRRVK
jgi:SAM-dependent methyltransferase